MRKFFITEEQINKQFSEWNKVAGSYRQMRMLETIVATQEIKKPELKPEIKLDQEDGKQV